MTTGLLLDSDEHVASYVFDVLGYRRMKFDRAIGLVQENHLVGGVIFQNYNGYDVHMSYYGQGTTLTAGIIKAFARFTIFVFDPSRVTMITSKRNKRIIRSLQKLGFVLEGSQSRYYGKRDCVRNTGMRLVMYRERIEALAGVISSNQRPAKHVNGTAAEHSLFASSSQR